VGERGRQLCKSGGVGNELTALGDDLTGPGTFFDLALSGEGTARDAFERLMTATAAAYTDPLNPVGCMVSLAGLHEAPERAEIGVFMRSVRSRARELMQQRLDKGIEAGELASDTDTAQLAEFFETVFRGMSVRARVPRF